MRLKNANNIVPLRDQVVLDVNTDIFITSEIIGLSNAIQIQHGEVRKLGPDARAENACPGLKIGDTALFSEFAGYHIVTNDDIMHKLIGGHSIMATTTDISSPSVETLNPTSDRLLLEIQYTYAEEGGLVLNEEEAKDPRLQDLAYGVIKKLGPNCPDIFQEGDLVGYQPYAGETVRERGSRQEPELRVIHANDALFVNK